MRLSLPRGLDEIDVPPRRPRRPGRRSPCGARGPRPRRHRTRRPRRPRAGRVGCRTTSSALRGRQDPPSARNPGRWPLRGRRSPVAAGVRPRRRSDRRRRACREDGDLVVAARSLADRLTDDPRERADAVSECLDRCRRGPRRAPGATDRRRGADSALRARRASSELPRRSAQRLCARRAERTASIRLGHSFTSAAPLCASSPSRAASCSAVAVTVPRQEVEPPGERADLLLDALLQARVIRWRGSRARAACSDTAWRLRRISANRSSVRSSPLASASVRIEIRLCSGGEATRGRPRTTSASVSIRSASVATVSFRGSEAATATVPERFGDSSTKLRSASSSLRTEARAAADR